MIARSHFWRSDSFYGLLDFLFDRDPGAECSLARSGYGGAKSFKLSPGDFGHSG
jgi:hypothetical protein